MEWKEELGKLKRRSAVKIQRWARRVRRDRAVITFARMKVGAAARAPPLPLPPLAESPLIVFALGGVAWVRAGPLRGDAVDPESRDQGGGAAVTNKVHPIHDTRSRVDAGVSSSSRHALHDARRVPDQHFGAMFREMRLSVSVRLGPGLFGNGVT